MRKKCLSCAKFFNKRINCSLNKWNTTVKFCSRSCINSGREPCNKGKKYPMSEQELEKMLKRLSHPDVVRKRIANLVRGRNHPHWVGGALKYQKQKARERENYTCQKCGLQDPLIVQVDHIIPIHKNPSLRNSLDNLQVLCPNCHARKTKADYGISLLDNVTINI